MIVGNITQNTILSSHTEIANNFFSRSIGLLGRASFQQGRALIIDPCNSIHMFFMKFAIDVVFIDNSGKVVGMIESIKPWHLSPIFWNALKAIELPENTIRLSKTKIGDMLEIK